MLKVSNSSFFSRGSHVAKMPLQALIRYFWTVGLQVLHLLRESLLLLQRPLAFLIAGYIVLSLLSFAGSIIITILTSALPSPSFPFAYNISHWFPSLNFTSTQPLTPFSHFAPLLYKIPALFRSITVVNSHAGPSPPFSDLTDVQGAAFDKLTNTSIIGIGIAVDISRLGAIALPALISMIRHSNITAKDVLIGALEDVADQAPRTSRSLQKFGSAVEEGLAVVLGTNKVAMRRIETGIGRPSYWFSTIIVPDSQLFERAIYVFEGAVDTLNLAAVACNHDLNRMETLLGTVEKVVRELHWAESWEREMLLSELWTFVGGNRHRLAGYNRNILWLDEALKFEKRAKENVLEARLTLNRMSDKIWALKRKFHDSSIPSGDHIALEIQYEVLAASIRQLTDIQARGFEGGETYYRGLRLT